MFSTRGLGQPVHTSDGWMGGGASPPQGGGRALYLTYLPRRYDSTPHQVLSFRITTKQSTNSTRLMPPPGPEGAPPAGSVCVGGNDGGRRQRRREESPTANRLVACSGTPCLACSPTTAVPFLARRPLPLWISLFFFNTNSAAPTRSDRGGWSIRTAPGANGGSFIPQLGRRTAPHIGSFIGFIDFFRCSSVHLAA